MYLLVPFILQNFKRIFRAGPELSGCDIFGHKMGHLSWTIFFTNLYYYFHLSVGLFHCAKFTKIRTADPFLGPKWSICPKQYFGKLVKSFSSNY